MLGFYVMNDNIYCTKIHECKIGGKRIYDFGEYSDRVNFQFMTDAKFMELEKNKAFVESVEGRQLLQWYHLQFQKTAALPENFNEICRNNPEKEGTRDRKDQHINVNLNSFGELINDDIVNEVGDFGENPMKSNEDPPEIKDILASAEVAEQINGLQYHIRNVIAHDMSVYLPYPLSNVVQIEALKFNLKRRFHNPY